MTTALRWITSVCLLVACAHAAADASSSAVGSPPACASEDCRHDRTVCPGGPITPTLAQSYAPADYTVCHRDADCEPVPMCCWWAGAIAKRFRDCIEPVTCPAVACVAPAAPVTVCRTGHCTIEDAGVGP